MKPKSFLCNVALLAVVALAVPLFAKPVSRTINIAQTARIGTTDLKAGEYHLRIDGNKATLQKGRDVIAEGQGHWEDRDQKPAYDSLLLGDDGQVREVRFAGLKQVFVFNQ